MKRKNRTENGLRLELKLSIPHSKAILASRLFFSSHRDIMKITITNTIVRPKAVKR